MYTRSTRSCSGSRIFPFARLKLIAPEKIKVAAKTAPKKADAKVKPAAAGKKVKVASAR